MNLNCREASGVSRNLCFPSLITLELSQRMILHLLSQTSSASSPFLTAGGWPCFPFHWETSSSQKASSTPSLTSSSLLAGPTGPAITLRRLSSICALDNILTPPLKDVLPEIVSLFFLPQQLFPVPRLFSTALKHALTCLKAVEPKFLFIYLSLSLLPFMAKLLESTHRSPTCSFCPPPNSLPLW